MREVVFAFFVALAATGCLGTPDTNDPSESTADDQCGECSLGETRCTDEGAVEECVDERDDACPVWMQTELCEDVTVCEEGQCVCAQGCDVDAPLDCSTTPTTLCVERDGCPMEIQPCYESERDCNTQCGEDGRGCTNLCADDGGTCWSCEGFVLDAAQ